MYRNTKFPPDAASTVTGIPPPLVSLQGQNFTTEDPVSVRQSLTDSESDFNVVTLDDDVPFSAVPLTAREVIPSRKSFFEKVEEIRRRSTDSTAFTSPGKLTQHKKSPSDSSTQPTSSPFIQTRLGDENVPEETGFIAQRASVGGQQQLQGFVRLQNERREEEENSLDGVIDWDFWGAVISDYQTFASKNAEKLAGAIQKGIPDALRGMMWQLMAASKDPQLEDTYLKLLKEKSSHEKAITRDLGRTFPHHAFFTDGQGIGQENLFNVLKAYSLYDPAVGYCQGLPFVVAILLLNMPDEEAFSLLVRLMYSYDLRGHFLPEMPKLQLRLYQFDRLLEELLPVLHLHFLRQGVKSSMFCSQWFLTLFSYRFPLNIVFRIYDSCLATGIEAIFGFSIALLLKNEEALLSFNFDQILTFIKNQIFDKYRVHRQIGPAGEGSEVTYRMDEFVQDAASLRITPFMLDSYAHEYEDLIRVRDAHTNEKAALQQHNRILLAQVKNLEATLVQLNSEHVEVLNELVKSRLRNEEIEEELVRYKFLYAEAMHENEDALSSHRISASTILSRKGSDI